ncbi:MAG: HAMP domain-containing protein [Caldilineae bacterium]|nr:MAG: HAMP domain-containing protein [Caldilineae bacterium]
MLFLIFSRLWRRRIWQWANGVSIRTKILVLVLAMGIVPGLLITMQTRRMVIGSLRHQLQQQGMSVAREVGARCADLVMCNDVETLNAILEDAWLYNRDLRYILILDAEGRVLASSLGPDFEEAYIISFGDYLRSDTTAYRQRLVNAGSEAILETTAPILGGAAGEIRVGLGEASMWQTVNTLTRQLVVVFVMITLVGVAAAFGLTWWLTRPVLALADAAAAAEQGDYSRRVEMTANDEIGALAAAFNALIEEVQRRIAECEQRERMRQFYLQRIIHAQEEERRRVARELHDETAQALASLVVGLRNVEEAPNEQVMRARLGDLRHVLGTTVEDVRRLARDLRPMALDDLGLVTALLLYADEYRQRFGVPVRIEVVDMEDVPLSPLLETTVYRIVQEALINAARHAACTEISVLLQAHDNILSVIVEDNGRGFDVGRVLGDGYNRSQFGIYGMKERAELVGGELQIESAPGKGCTVYLRIPLPTQSSAAEGKEVVRT